MPLKLNGAVLDLNPPSKTLVKVLAILDKLGPDDLYDKDHLSQMAKVSPTMFKCDLIEACQDYTMIVGKVRYWGSKKAITAGKSRRLNWLDIITNSITDFPGKFTPSREDVPATRRCLCARSGCRPMSDIR